MKQIDRLAIKLETEMKLKDQPVNHLNFYKAGFLEAFNLLNAIVDEELKKVEEYPWMGERKHTLIVYRRRFEKLLSEMEEDL